MLERIISNRLTEYLESNELFYPRQIGFRKGYSTTLAISKFVSDVNLAQNDNNLTDCIYIYLCKAFDFIKPNILIDKLRSYVGMV